MAISVTPYLLEGPCDKGFARYDHFRQYCPK